jgi:hypothetical protein
MTDEMLSESSIAAPGFYIGDEDNLRGTVYNALAGVRVTLAGRWMSARDGRVSAFEREITPTSDRVASVVTVRLGEGWILSAHLYASNGAPVIGQTFGVISIVRGQTGGVVELATLAAAYFTAKQRAAWPGQPIENSLDGAGALRYITGTNPGAGQNLVETVPTGARWQLLSLKFNLSTSGVAGNRIPSLLLDDGTNYYYESIHHTATAATANRDYLWLHGLPIVTSGSTTGVEQGFSPTLWIPSGHRIRTGVAALDAGDAITSIRYVVREWLEGN